MIYLFLERGTSIFRKGFKWQLHSPAICKQNVREKKRHVEPAQGNGEQKAVGKRYSKWFKITNGKIASSLVFSFSLSIHLFLSVFLYPLSFYTPSPPISIYASLFSCGERVKGWDWYIAPKDILQDSINHKNNINTDFIPLFYSSNFLIKEHLRRIQKHFGNFSADNIHQ